MQNKERIIIVILAIALLGTIVFLAPQSQRPAESPTGSQNATGTTSQANQQTGGTNSDSSNQGAPSVSLDSLAVIDPTPGVEWVIDVPHLITWNKPTGIGGSIYLVDAKTNATVGWITPSLVSNQTSYSWNTKDVALSRTNPQRKDIATGSYIIKIEFDRKPAIRVQSAPFSVIYPSQEKFLTYNISLSNFKFNVGSLAVMKGDTIVITNNDATTYVFKTTGLFDSFSLSPGASKTINTGPMTAGSFGMYSEVYPSARFSFTVTAK